MEKKKIALTDQQKKILVPAIWAVILLAGLSYFIFRSMNVLQGLERSLSQVSRKEKAIAKLEALELKEKEMLKAFPAVSEKNDVIKEIAGWGRKEGLEVNKIEPKEDMLPGTNFRQLTFTMNGSGGYLSIMRFLKRIEKSSYFILVSGLQVSGYDLQRGRLMTTGPGAKAAALTHKNFKVTVNVVLLAS